MSFLRQWWDHLVFCFMFLIVIIVIAIVHTKFKIQAIKTHNLNEVKTAIVYPIIANLEFKKDYFLIDEKITVDPFQTKTVSLPQDSSLQNHTIHLRYAKAEEVAAVLREKQNHLLSLNSSLVIDKRTNTLLIQENTNYWRRVNSIITALDMPLKQIALEARIVNIDIDKEHDLGMDFNIKSSNSAGNSNDTSSSGSSSNEFSSAGTRAIAVIKLNSDTLLDLKLDALESQGRVDIIARPKLITTEQQSAYIESGEEIPYQEAAAEGVTKVAFKKAVLSLRVTPKLIDQKKILLDMQVNQDSRGNALINGVPTINTQQIASQILVNNGQTVVLGGIYQQTKSNQSQRVPFLSDIPYLGVLFKDRQTSESRKELLIFITPRIVS